MTPLRVLAIAGGLATMGFMAFNAVIGLVARQLGLLEWQVGLLVSLAGLALVVVSAAWGRASDRRGRLPIMRLGLVGYVLGFAAMGVYLAWSQMQLQAGIVPAVALSFGVLMLTRLAVSVLYGAYQTAAQAYAADVTTEATRAQAMAALGLGQAVGMVLGPASASALSAVNLNSPIWAATVLGMLALAMVHRRLPPPPQRPLGPQTTLNWRDRRIRFALFTGFAAFTCIMSAQVVTGFFAQDRFGLATQQAAALAGAALTCVGLALVCAQLIVRRLAWPPWRIVATGAAISAVGFSTAIWVAAPWQMMAGFFCSGFGMGFVFPGMQAANANAVQAHEQGAAAGTLGAAQAMGMVIGPLAATALYRQVGPSAPFALAGALMAVTCVAALWQRRRTVAVA
ncbi:MAG: MFS transporter [Aquabacterium sp.]